MNLPIITFKSVGREIGLDVHVDDGRLQVKDLLPRPLWALRLSSIISWNPKRILRKFKANSACKRLEFSLQTHAN